MESHPLISNDPIERSAAPKSSAPLISASTRQCQQAIRVPELMQLLNRRSPRVQKTAARALWSLWNASFQNKASQPGLAEACKGAITSLVDLLSSKEEFLQEAGAAVLGFLMCHNEQTLAETAQKILQCQEAVPRLVQLLSSSNEGVREQAVVALFALNRGAPAALSMYDSNQAAIASLVALLNSSDRAAVSAASLLCNFAYSSPASREMIGGRQGAIEGLVSLLSRNSGWVSEAAAAALSNIACGCPTNSKLIGKTKGAMPALVQLLNSNTEGLQYAAADALFELGNSYTANCQLIRECPGAVAGLTSLSQSRSERVRDAAHMALRAIGHKFPPAAGTRHHTLGANKPSPTTATVASAPHCARLATPSTRDPSAAASAAEKGLNHNQRHRHAGRSGVSSARPPDDTSPAGAALGAGEAILRVAGGVARNIPVWGPLVEQACVGVATILRMVQQTGLNKAKAGLLAGRVNLINGVLQDLKLQTQSTDLQLTDAQQANIVTALKHVVRAFEAAKLLLARWTVPNQKDVWAVVKRFAFSEQDKQDLIEVDAQLCISYSQLTGVLSTCSFFELQRLAGSIESTVKAAMKAYHHDIADFEKNLISNAGGLDKVNLSLQEHRQELQAIWPALESIGVQLVQLNTVAGKVDAVAVAVEGLERKVEDLMTYMQQQRQQRVLMPKPELLILQDNITVVGDRLGRGGFGTVYPAKYGREDVAVKVFWLQEATDDDMKEVYREAILLSRLQHHPNIIRCFGIISSTQQGRGDTTATAAASNSLDLHGSLVLEKCDMDLHILLRDSKVVLSLLDKVHIALDIASGMRYLHHDCGSLAPVIHGDLKPSNVLINLGTDGKPRQVKVADFGISRTCQVSNTLYIKTTGRYRGFGGEQWLAPEACEVLLSNKKGRCQPNTKQLDVYAFGIVLYEVVTRQPPFDGVDTIRLPHRVFNGLRPDAQGWLQQQQRTELNGVRGRDNISELSVCRKLVSVMESCWAADPAARPSFQAIAAELRDLQQAAQEIALVQVHSSEPAGNAVSLVTKCSKWLRSLVLSVN